MNYGNSRFASGFPTIFGVHLWTSPRVYARLTTRFEDTPPHTQLARMKTEKSRTPSWRHWDVFPLGCHTLRATGLNPLNPRLVQQWSRRAYDLASCSRRSISVILVSIRRARSCYGLEYDLHLLSLDLRPCPFGCHQKVCL